MPASHNLTRGARLYVEVGTSASPVRSFPIGQVSEGVLCWRIWLKIRLAVKKMYLWSFGSNMLANCEKRKYCRAGRGKRDIFTEWVLRFTRTGWIRWFRCDSHLDYLFNTCMASNAMSRIENPDGTCLVQTLLSHTFLPWSFCTGKQKITLLAFFSQKRTECESHFKWFCTSLVKLLSLTLISPS